MTDLYARNTVHPDALRETAVDVVEYVEAKLRAMVEAKAKELGKPLKGSIAIRSYEDYPFQHDPEQLVVVFEAHGVTE